MYKKLLKSCIIMCIMFVCQCSPGDGSVAGETVTGD